MPEPHAFNPDRPITSAGADKLNVDPFVRRLLGPLLNSPAESSLVLGLYGEWGHGKSSALNLLEAALVETRQQEFHARKPTVQAQVVRFTPWLYSDVETLLRAFFETLAEGIGGFDTAAEEKRGKLTHALRGIGEFVAPAIKLGALIVAEPAMTSQA